MMESFLVKLQPEQLMLDFEMFTIYYLGRK